MIKTIALKTIKELSCITLCYYIVCKDKNNLITQLKFIKNKNLIQIIRILQNYFYKISLVKIKENLKLKSLEFIINQIKPPIFCREKKFFLNICSQTTLKESLNLLQELVDIELTCKKFFFSNPCLIFSQYLIKKIK